VPFPSFTCRRAACAQENPQHRRAAGRGRKKSSRSATTAVSSSSSNTMVIPMREARSEEQDAGNGERAHSQRGRYCFFPFFLKPTQRTG
jgi:hypothetical protein